MSCNGRSTGAPDRGQGSLLPSRVGWPYRGPTVGPLRCCDPRDSSRPAASHLLTWRPVRPY